MKPKKCASCATPFTPDRMGQIACSPKCAYQTVEIKKVKKRKRESNQAKKKFLENDKHHWANKAKDACHKYIRARDASDPCISCGATGEVQYCAGHYRPSGVNSALRYDELNIHKQCNRNCNMGMSGNLIAYRAGLIDKIGIDLVQWLDCNHEVKRWTLDELKEVHRYYTDKLKQLKG